MELICPSSYEHWIAENIDKKKKDIRKISTFQIINNEPLIFFTCITVEWLGVVVEVSVYYRVRLCLFLWRYKMSTKTGIETEKINVWDPYA